MTETRESGSENLVTIHVVGIFVTSMCHIYEYVKKIINIDFRQRVRNRRIRELLSDEGHRSWT